MSEPFEFEIGDGILVYSDERTLTGRIVARFYIFPESEAGPRYVARHATDGGGFWCDIYNPNQLRSARRAVKNPEASRLHESSSAQSQVREEGGDQAVSGEGVLDRRQGGLEELQEGQQQKEVRE